MTGCKSAAWQSGHPGEGRGSRRDGGAQLMVLLDQVEQELYVPNFASSTLHLFSHFIPTSEMRKQGPERYNHLLLVTQHVRGELGLEPRPSYTSTPSILLRNAYPEALSPAHMCTRIQGGQSHCVVGLFPNCCSHRTCSVPVSYTHLTLPTRGSKCISRWSPYH